MRVPTTVTIREVGPREGVQTSSVQISLEQKLKLIEALSATGIKDIEITALVRAGKVPQMADADEIIKQYKRDKGIRYTALYLNKAGFERGEALCRLDNVGWIHIAASETFLKKNNNVTIDESINRIPDLIDAFITHKKQLQGIMLSSSFGCAYEGKIDSNKVLFVLRKIIEVMQSKNVTPNEICLADTVGLGNPRSIQETVKAVQDAFGIDVSLHLHDTRGLGIANVYAGLLSGVRIFEASVGGVGGCPFTKGAAGNVATEEVILLCHELGIDTGIDLKKYLEIAELSKNIFGTAGRIISPKPIL